MDGDSSPKGPEASQSTRRAPLSIAALLAIGLTLVAAGIALAAFHTVNQWYHGIGNHFNAWTGTEHPRAITSQGWADGTLGWAQAGVYHLRDDGGWSTQCFAQKGGDTWCDGQWGSAPCRKYAWSSGSGAGNPNRVLSWHGHNKASC
jgi:hypothetical protein